MIAIHPCFEIRHKVSNLSEQKHITNRSLSRRDELVDGKNSMLVVYNIFVLIYWYSIVFNTSLINRVFNYRKKLEEFNAKFLKPLTINLIKLMEHYEIRKQSISNLTINNHKHA